MIRTLIILILLAGTAFGAVAPDPLRIAAGARYLGLGRAYMAISGDVNSIYSNPAGIAEISNWQLTSMSGSLLNEYSYLNLGGIYPVANYGNFGIGFVNVSVGGAFPTTIEAGSDPTDLVYAINPSLSPMNYHNSVFLLSYGIKMNRFLEWAPLSGIGTRFPWLKEVCFGSNLKLTSVGLSGGGVTNASGSGMELDLGIQSKTGLPWLALGATAQNILPASMGGKIAYDTGWEESYPMVLKGGIIANILGDNRAIRSFRNQKLDLILDLQMEPTQSNVPMLMKLGLEWYPVDITAIRFGIDQAMAGSSTTNNLSLGVGVNFRQFRFDYAYHQLQGAPGVSNHFFSLTYGIAAAEPEKIEYIKIDEPLYARIITTSAEVKVAGRLHPDVGSAKIDETWLSFGKDGSFEAVIPAAGIGKNTLLAQAFDKKGKLLERKTVKALRLMTYPDVPPEYWAYEQINYIGTLGIVKGYPDGGFRPEGDITRAELSTLLVRTRAGSDEAIPQPTRLLFTDVPFKHWASKYITYAASEEIVKGYPDGSFRPSGNVTRAEGLTMIARFAKVSEEAYAPLFVDVPKSHWASKIITGAHKAGMLEYFRRKPFEPSRYLTRAEAVEILFRSKPIEQMIDKLRDFESGYDPSAASAPKR